jgi:integral membrane protein (TIGR01906 family)
VKKWIKASLKFLLMLLIPPILLITGVRILINPSFAKIEYNLPNFPEDKFGFSLEDRLNYADPSIRYLVNSEDISYLAELKFPDGTRIYNERELSHMEDVKNLVQIVLKFWLSGLAIVLVIVLILENNNERTVWQKGLYWGGWITLGLVGIIILFLVINFNELFNWFHYIFFEGDTWLFWESDTLIRLFPIPFWRDAFIFIGFFTFTSALSLVLIFRSRRVFINKKNQQFD